MKYQAGQDCAMDGGVTGALVGVQSLAGKRQSDCDAVVAKLNARPRKRYGFKTPIQRMQQLSGVLHLVC